MRSKLFCRCTFVNEIWAEILGGKSVGCTEKIWRERTVLILESVYLCSPTAWQMALLKSGLQCHSNFSHRPPKNALDFGPFGCWICFRKRHFIDKILVVGLTRCHIMSELLVGRMYTQWQEYLSNGQIGRSHNKSSFVLILNGTTRQLDRTDLIVTSLGRLQIIQAIKSNVICCRMYLECYSDVAALQLGVFYACRFWWDGVAGRGGVQTVCPHRWSVCTIVIQYWQMQHSCSSWHIHSLLSAFSAGNIIIKCH